MADLTDPRRPYSEQRNLVLINVHDTIERNTDLYHTDNELAITWIKRYSRNISVDEHAVDYRFLVHAFDVLLDGA